MSAITMPSDMTREDGSRRYAYVTFLMMNDSYLSGALLMAYGLKKQWTEADIICLVTPEITASARAALACIYDHVVEVETIFVPHKRRHERHDRPFWFTRMNALRLGSDGDLGFAYEKIVVLDADVLPMKWYDHLFTLEAPAGVMNESKENCIDEDEQGTYIVPEHLHAGTEWNWHDIYRVCPHGSKIPSELTDRVVADPENNTGVSGSCYVWQPSMQEYCKIRELISESPEVIELVGDRFDYPDMQYLTKHWSGQWTSIDLRFIGFKGYPGLGALYGTHYAGFKPWYFNQPQALERYLRYADFQLWYREYLSMVLVDFPQLQKSLHLARLLQAIQALQQFGLMGKGGVPKQEGETPMDKDLPKEQARKNAPRSLKGSAAQKNSVAKRGAATKKGSTAKRGKAARKTSTGKRKTETIRDKKRRRGKERAR